MPSMLYPKMWSASCVLALLSSLSVYGASDVLPGKCAAVHQGTGRWQTKCPTMTAQSTCETMAPGKCQWVLNADFDADADADLASDAKQPNVEGSLRAPFNSGTQELSLLISREEVTITMVGWSTGGWFGFGFGQDTMEGAYAIVAEGSMFDTVVSEYKLSKFSEDQQENRVDSGLKIVSDTTEGLYRTVVMTRPREDSKTYTFPQDIGKIPMIAAKANYYEPFIAYHGGTRDQLEIRMDLVEDATCRTECCADDDCRGDKVCLEDGSCGKDCEFECCSDSDCRGQMVCLSDRVCGKATEECAFDCCSDDDCRGAQVCRDDKTCGKEEAECAYECCSDDECRGSKVCNDGACGAPAKSVPSCEDECCSDDDCRGSQVCNDGECGKYTAPASSDSSDSAECYTDDDCPGRKVCKGGACTSGRMRAHVERQMFVEAEVGSGSGAEATQITVTTSDVLLCIALLVTAAFAVEQLWRWWKTGDAKLDMGAQHEVSPLLPQQSV